MKRLISGLPLLFTAATLLAQSSSPDDTGASSTPEVMSDKAAGIAALIGGSFCLIFVVVWLAIWLGIAIWVTKDAKRRQSPNATLVTVLAWIPPTTVIGLIVHLVTRPKTIPGSPNP
jgi:ABC-type phosphate transport system permease subunit